MFTKKTIYNKIKQTLSFYYTDMGIIYLNRGIKYTILLRKILRIVVLKDGYGYHTCKI